MGLSRNEVTTIFLSGPETNHWVHRRGRMYLRSKDYFSDFEKVYGASGVLPSLDGADHFRLRKSLSSAYSRARLMGQLDQLYYHTRKYMADWKVGDTYQATRMSRRMVNAQISPLSVSFDSQDIIDDLMKYKERALLTHIIKALPRFMLSTPGMRRRAKAGDKLLERVENVHTSAQRADSPRDLADDILSLHASDPQFVPESNLRFALSAALIASVYLGDALSFALYAMASQPEIYARIQVGGELKEGRVSAFRVVDQKLGDSWILDLKLVEKRLHQRRIQFHSGRGFPEESLKFRVVFVARLHAVIDPVVYEDVEGFLNGPCRRPRTSRIILETGCEVVHVQKGAGLGGFGLYQYAYHFRRTANRRVEGLHILQNAPASWQDVADSGLRFKISGCKAKGNGHRKNDDEKGSGPAGNTPPQNYRNPLDTGQRVLDRRGGDNLLRASRRRSIIMRLAGTRDSMTTRLIPTPRPAIMPKSATIPIGENRFASRLTMVVPLASAKGIVTWRNPARAAPSTPSPARRCSR